MRKRCTKGGRSAPGKGSNLSHPENAPPDQSGGALIQWVPPCRDAPPRKLPFSGSVQDGARQPQITGEQAPAQRNLHGAVVLADEVWRSLFWARGLRPSTRRGGSPGGVGRGAQRGPPAERGERGRGARTGKPYQAWPSRPRSPPPHGPRGRGARAEAAGGTTARRRLSAGPRPSSLATPRASVRCAQGIALKHARDKAARRRGRDLRCVETRERGIQMRRQRISGEDRRRAVRRVHEGSMNGGGGCADGLRPWGV